MICNGVTGVQAMVCKGAVGAPVFVAEPEPASVG